MDLHSLCHLSGSSMGLEEMDTGKWGNGGLYIVNKQILYWEKM